MALALVSSLLCMSMLLLSRRVHGDNHSNAILTSTAATTATTPTTTAKWQARDDACKEMLVRLPPTPEIYNVAPASFPLHFDYKPWSSGDIVGEISSGVARFTWARNLDSVSTSAGGHLIYGNSYATGRQCAIHAIELYDHPMHSYAPSQDARVKPVLMEVQLHHKCSSQEGFEHQADQDEKDILEQRHEKTEFLADLGKVADSLATVTDMKAYNQRTETIKGQIHQAEDKIASLQKDKSFALTATSLEKQWHRPDLPVTTIVSLPVSFHQGDHEEDGEQKENVDVMEFLENLVSKTDGSGNLNQTKLQDPSSVVLRAGQVAFMYKGPAANQPCNNVQWIVSAEPLYVNSQQMVDMTRLKQKLNKIVPEAERHVSAGSERPMDQNLTLVSWDKKYLPRPRYTPEQEASRTPLFIALLCLILVIGMGMHIANIHDADAYLFAMMVAAVIYLLLSFFGIAFWPGPDMSSPVDQYGFGKAWDSACKSILAYWNPTSPQMWIGIILTIFLLILTIGSYGLGIIFPIVWLLLALVKAHDAFPGWLKWIGYLVLDAWPVSTLIYLVICVTIWGLSSYAHVLGSGFSIVYGFQYLYAFAFIPFLPILAYSGLSFIPQYQWLMNLASEYVPILSWGVRVVFYGVPLAAITFEAPWFVLPFWASFSHRANCIDGFDWEVHVAFAAVLVIKSFFWKAITNVLSRGSSIIQRCKIYGFYLMAELDMYTDSMFIVIATECGSWYGYAALISYSVGVVLLQIILPSIGFALQGGGEGPSNVQAMWTILLFPAEALVGPKEGGYSPINVSHVDAQAVKFQVMMLAILRILGEDLPQCVLQYLFTIHVKKNPMIIFSIITSVVSSLLTVGKAIHAYYYD